MVRAYAQTFPHLRSITTQHQHILQLSFAFFPPHVLYIMNCGFWNFKPQGPGFTPFPHRYLNISFQNSTLILFVLNKPQNVKCYSSGNFNYLKNKICLVIKKLEYYTNLSTLFDLMSLTVYAPKACDSQIWWQIIQILLYCLIIYTAINYCRVKHEIS